MKIGSPEGIKNSSARRLASNRLKLEERRIWLLLQRGIQCAYGDNES
jgi:hypothetical protein